MTAIDALTRRTKQPVVIAFTLDRIDRTGRPSLIVGIGSTRAGRVLLGLRDNQGVPLGIIPPVVAILVMRMTTRRGAPIGSLDGRTCQARRERRASFTMRHVTPL